MYYNGHCVKQESRYGYFGSDDRYKRQRPLQQRYLHPVNGLSIGRMLLMQIIGAPVDLFASLEPVMATPISEVDVR